MKRALNFIREMMRPMSPENDWFPLVAVLVTVLAYVVLMGLLMLVEMDRSEVQAVPVVKSLTGEVVRP